MEKRTKRNEKICNFMSLRKVSLAFQCFAFYRKHNRKAWDETEKASGSKEDRLSLSPIFYILFFFFPTD